MSSVTGEEGTPACAIRPVWLDGPSMADALLRDLERRFEANPEDPEVFGRLDEEYGRARRDLPWPILIRCPRWRSFIDFAARFVEPLGPDDGLTSAELDRAERRLGLRLPRALREWYRLAGRRDDVLGRRDHPVPARELGVQDGVLFIYEEDEELFRWGVLVDELGHDDPRIVTREDAGDAPTVWNERLSEFCWQMAIHQLLVSGKGRSTQAVISPFDSRAKVGALYPRLPLPGWSFRSAEPEAVVHFGDPETLLELDIDGPTVSVVAATDAALARARAALLLLEPGWYDDDPGER